MAKITCQINGKTCVVEAGTTILWAARENGIEIPTLCHFEGITARANCRICVVEVEGMRVFQPSCVTKVAEGMVIQTDTEKLRRVRKTTLQMIMAHHAVDCHHCMRIGSSSEASLDPMFCEMCFWCDCERDGFCELQTLCREYGVDALPYIQREKDYQIDDSLKSVVRNPNKCIKCRRCVDVCNELQTVCNLSMANRGSDIMVVPELGKSMKESPCIRCGRCASVCPTGAIYMQEHIDEIIYMAHQYGTKTIAQLDEKVIPELEKNYKLNPGSISLGQVITALHKIGIDYVVTDMYAKTLVSEKLQKAAEKGKRFVSDSFAVKNFVKEFYPEMADQIGFVDSAQKIFGEYAKGVFSQEKGIDPARLYTINVTSVNEDCAEAAENRCVDYAINARELYRIFMRTGGAPHLKNEIAPDMIDSFDKESSDRAGKFIVSENLGQVRAMLEALKAGHEPEDICRLKA